MDDPRLAVEFCSDDELGYERTRTQITPGAGLVLDEAYRLAHLPLVAPDHPRAIPAREGTTYFMGRHARLFSLVLPVPGGLLCRSPAYHELDQELREAPFGRKIAWGLLEQRQRKLHATICGSLSVDDPPLLEESQRRELARIGPVRVELRGLFSGNVNVGRLYFRVYPERRKGMNVFRHIQRTLGRRETDLYVVGIYNLLDDLDAGEASALRSMIERWWDRPVLSFEADHLWLLGAMDDLVLDGAVEEVVRLVGNHPSAHA